MRYIIQWTFPRFPPSFIVGGKEIGAILAAHQDDVAVSWQLLLGGDPGTEVLHTKIIGRRGGN